MHDRGIDVSKFESWPLLPPDELASLPTEVLRASVVELELMCIQASDGSGDPIADYARRQRSRAASVLSERAARDRVQALLAGTAVATSRTHSQHSKRMSPDVVPEATPQGPHNGAPFHGDWSAARATGNGKEPMSNTLVGERPLTFAPGFACSGEDSTPRPVAKLQREQSSGIRASSAKEADSYGDGRRINEPTGPKSAPLPQSLDGRKRSSSVWQTLAPASHNVDASGGGFRNGPGNGITTDRLKAQNVGGRPSFNSVVHEKWGSVFVVGGGRRRKRAPVRQRSAELDDTPESRRAHMDKERQERRKASLSRLLARKDHRARQQEARRKRKASTARAAAAAAPGTAATTDSLPAVDVSPRTSPRSRRRPRTPTIARQDLGGSSSTVKYCPARRSSPVPRLPPPTCRSAGEDGNREELPELPTKGGEGHSDDLVGSGDIQTPGERRGVTGSVAFGEVTEKGPQTCAGRDTAPVPGFGRAVAGLAGIKERPTISTADGNGSVSESESVSGGDTSDGDLSTDNLDASVDINEQEQQRMPKQEKPPDLRPAEREECGTLARHSGGSGGRAVAMKGGEARADTHREAAKEERDGRIAEERATYVAIRMGQDVLELRTAPRCARREFDRGRSACSTPESTTYSATEEHANAKSSQSVGAAAPSGPVDLCVVAAVGERKETVIDEDLKTDLDGDDNSELECGDRGSLELPGPLDVQPIADIALDTVAFDTGAEDVGGQRKRSGAFDAAPVDSEAAVSCEWKEHTSPFGISEALPRPSHAKIRPGNLGPGWEGVGSVGSPERHAVMTALTPRFFERELEAVRPSSLNAWSNERQSEKNVSAEGPAGAPVRTTSGGTSDDACMRRVLAEGSCPKENAVKSRDCMRQAGGIDGFPEFRVAPASDRHVGRFSNPHTDQKEMNTHLDQKTKLKTKSLDFAAERSTKASPAHSAAPSRARSHCSNNRVQPSSPLDGRFVSQRKSGSSDSFADYADHFPRFAAILSAYHNGRNLTREEDCRSLPLTSTIMSRAGGGRRGRSGLTVAEEETCLHWQWKLYAIYVRVIKDYAAVFSYGDAWPSGGEEDPSSLVYSGDPSALHYRVNSKARPEVYNIVTDVLNNRCEQWEELPTGLGLKTTWNLLWTWSKPHIQYSSLLAWQKVNHFPNSRELTRKDLLKKHISRFMAPGGRLAKEFHIIPQTFVLPHEFTQFVAAFSSPGWTRSDGGAPGPGSPPGGSVDSIDDGSWDKEDKKNGRGGKGGMGVWIMKPVGMSRGRGIRLVDDIKKISYADKVVVQRYVGNPLLLDGYKFDLRLFVLVTSFNKLEAFIYKEGFARLSTHRYEKGAIDNRFIHLTNSSIQRLNDSGATRDNPLHHANASEAGGTKTTLSYLWRRLDASGVDVGALWADVCSVVVKSLVCVEGSIPNQPNSFELFGYDVLIDDRLRPWLIEVNASPSMARENRIDRQVKEALIFDSIHLVDPLPFDREKLVDALGRRLSEAKSPQTRRFKQRFHTPGGIDSMKGAGSGEGSRRGEEEENSHRDLDEILCGRRPRRVGEMPARMGNFVRLCPATAAYRRATRLRRKVVRPHPGEEKFPPSR